MTPLGSLAFQYAEGIKGFNSQKGLFDVAIEGDSTATAFKLTSRLITNTLTQLDTSGSTLNVGVDYNGAAVEKTGDTVMIDTANGVLAATLARWLTVTMPAIVPPHRMVSPSPSSAAPPMVPPQ